MNCGASAGNLCATNDYTGVRLWASTRAVVYRAVRKCRSFLHALATTIVAAAAEHVSVHSRCTRRRRDSNRSAVGQGRLRRRRALIIQQHTAAAVTAAATPLRASIVVVAGIVVDYIIIFCYCYYDCALV